MKKGYRDLKVWQESMVMIENIYNAAKSFSSGEIYDLTRRMWRAAVAIPSNIPEGHGCGGGDSRRFLDIVYGPNLELQTQMEISFRLGSLNEENFSSLAQKCSETGKMIKGLKYSLSKQPLGAN